MKTNNLLDTGISLLKRIEALGFKAYIVGGTPRDLILGRVSNDIDIATNCPIEIIEKNFTTHNIGESKDFGILTIRWGKFMFEVAQFRSDGEYKDGRHPDNVKIVGDFKQDVVRRDFTINALGLDSNRDFIDYASSIADIQDRLVRAVGDPYKRFQEDHLRMIRAARFAAFENFSLEKETRKAIIDLSKLICKVKPERIRMELVKAAEKSGPQFARFILILDDLKLLERILPEVANMRNFEHNMEHHPEGPTVFDHVIACLNLMGEGAPIYKMAALLHDIGKCLTLGVSKKGTPNYHGHEQESAKMAADICDRLKFSLYDKEGIVFAAANHMKLHYLLEMKPSKIARLVSSAHFDILLEVARVDEFCRGEKFKYKGMFEKGIKRAYEIAEKWCGQAAEKPKKLVDGKRIMEITGIKPGPLVGEIKHQVEDHIIDNDLDPTDDKLMYELILRAFTMGGL
jgi:poly(A) polymerase